mgnify:CR=1 FL=1
MTPKQQYYKNIADTMISNLKKRGFEADYVPDRQAALRAITPYLTKGNTVSCGGSITLAEIGFNTAVKEADCIFLDRTIAKTQEEKDAVYSKVAVCDYYFMSNNASQQMAFWSILTARAIVLLLLFMALKMSSLSQA